MAAAEAACAEATKLAPSNAIALTNYGFALAQQKKTDQAVAEYRRAIKADPKYALAYKNLGVALANQGEREEATTIWEKALELDPGDDQIRENLKKLQPNARK